MITEDDLPCMCKILCPLDKLEGPRWDRDMDHLHGMELFTSDPIDGAYTYTWCEADTFQIDVRWLVRKSPEQLSFPFIG